MNSSKVTDNRLLSATVPDKTIGDVKMRLLIDPVPQHEAKQNLKVDPNLVVLDTLNGNYNDIPR